MNDTGSDPLPTSSTQPNPFTWLLVIGFLLWSLLVTLIVQGYVLGQAWFTDLTKMELTAQEYLGRGLLQPLLILAPALLLLLLRDRRQKAIVRTMLWAAIAGGLLLIPRLVFAPEAVYAAGLARAIIGLAFGLGLLLWAGRGGHLRKKPGPGLALAALIGFLFLAPWLLYGAVGDSIDLLVALLQVFGLALLATALAAYLMPKLVATTAKASANVWLGGITLGIGLTVIASAWGQMDYQALLLGVLGGLGLPLALLGIREDGYDIWSALLLVALASLGPLAFADPRETRLMLVLIGDTAMWSFRATTIDFLLGLVLAFLIGLFNVRLFQGRIASYWTKIAAIAAVGAVILYVAAGQPGWNGDAFFLVLEDQADLSAASAIPDVDARRAAVYETLTSVADDTQGDIVKWLEERGIPYTRYYLVNGIEVRGNVLRRLQLERRPEVRRVLFSSHLRPIPELPPLEPGLNAKPEEIAWGIEAIGAPRVWSELGVTGEGIVVGQSDTGVDASHPALASNYRGRDNGDTYNWFDTWYGDDTPYDMNGHGTHTLGTAVGKDGVGVAPGATWFACANQIRPSGNIAYYLDCMQFMLAPHPQDGDPLHDGRPDLAADVSTNSWGCPYSVEGCDEDTLWLATEALKAAGIFFVAAAGNEGPACNSLETPPGNYDNVFAVGAIDPGGDMTSFSSRGPETKSPDGNDSPELLAPGEEVTSAWPGDEWNSLPGTSMAAPHVAGVVALMWSANPRLRGDLQATKRILIETAAPYTGADDGCGIPGEIPDTGAGYGIVDAYSAVQRALKFE